MINCFFLFLNIDENDGLEKSVKLFECQETDWMIKGYLTTKLKTIYIVFVDFKTTPTHGKITGPNANKM